MASKKRKVPLPASDEKIANYPVVVDLPLNTYKGIGKIISIHALLENFVSDLVFMLMKVSPAEGRTAFAYRAASAQFKLVRSLLDLRGIAITKFSLNEIGDQIEDCCTMRDQLAHGVWVEREGQIGLRLTKGTFESPEGLRNRAITPQGMGIPTEYYEQARGIIKDTIVAVQALTEEVRSALQTSPEKS